MNGWKYRFRFKTSKDDCDLCVVRFMQGKSPPLCDPVPPDCPHIINKENGIEDSTRSATLKDVRRAILKRFGGHVFYSRSSILTVIDELEVDEKELTKHEH